ncbi:MAG: replicative DNA helicase [Rhodospirillales bacterium]|nr:replicative DNA helicase [Rhodospirillales bacterium]
MLQAVPIPEAPTDSAIEKSDLRVFPHNQEAEQGLLGALMTDNQALEKINDFLRPEHFFFPAHMRIYKAIETLIDRGQVADATTLKNYFELDKDLAPVGGADYLFSLAANFGFVFNVSNYARTIYDLHMRRELIRLGRDVVDESFEHKLEKSPGDLIEETETRLFHMAETGTGDKGFVTIRDSVNKAIAMAEQAFHRESQVSGVTTGLRDLNEMLGGLQPSDLLILAARPSMGKTSLAMNIAYNAAKAYAQNDGGARTCFFSLEMSSDQLAGRLLAERSGISSAEIRKGTVKKHELQQFIEASHELSQIPLYIDDTPALSIGAVRTRARRLKRQHGCDLIIVDYLQLLRGSGSAQSESNRVQEVSEITRGLKAIAKELNVPVLALSQLSRAVEQREDKRPMLSDLRESGSIEQDADIVMFIFREEYYLERSQPDIDHAEKYASWQERMDKVHNVAEVIVAKQRHGPVGTVRTFFDPKLTRFSDLQRDF